MATIEVHCPSCNTTKTVKFGTTPERKQRYLCKNTNCDKKTFILDYTNKGCLPEVKSQIVEMSINGSGIRDTARVLQISIGTVLSELKKKNRE